MRKCGNFRGRVSNRGIIWKKSKMVDFVIKIASSRLRQSTACESVRDGNIVETLYGIELD